MEIIAEVGQAHEGSLGMALAYIDALAEAGVDTVKFQMHIAESESSIYEPFRINFSPQDKTRYDYWKRMEFTEDQWKILKTRCVEKGVEFLASPFSNLAVDLLEKLGVNKYKVGSGEINNFLLLEKLKRTGKPIILSSGMSSFEELDKCVKFIKKANTDFRILQCTTSYPTQPKNFGLNVIKELKDRYNVPVGFSDHSARKETCIAAAALGAEILEFHAVFSRKSFGPDTSSSLEIREVRELVRSVRNIEKALLNPINKLDNSQYLGLKGIFEKSLAVNKDLPKGHILKFEDLEAKKPKGLGLSPDIFHEILGKSLTRSCKKWEFLKPDMIQ